MPRNHHDALFRVVFSQPDQAAAHLRAALPAEVVRHLDLPEAARADLAPWLVDFRYVLEDLGEIEWMSTLQSVVTESGLRAVETVMRYVIEVEKGPPTPELQRLLVDQVGRDAMETIMSWAQELRKEGREEGRGLGRLEEARHLLLRLLAQRFGPVSDDVAHAVQQAPLDQLEAWTDRLFVAESADDVVSG